MCRYLLWKIYPEMEISDWYATSKALHLIGMVSWMAGLFYLVRLFVYHAEAGALPQPEQGILTRQYALMEGRVYRIILRPAVVITWVFGSLMLAIQPVWLEQPWLWVKLTFVLTLTGYTVYCQVHVRRLADGTSRFSHAHYRVMNEVPTIILVAAVFLAGFKSRINWFYLIGGVGVFAALILMAIRKVARKS